MLLHLTALVVLALCIVDSALLTHAAAAQPAPTTDSRLSPALPTSVDLRPRFDHWNLPPRRQGGRGTCSVFTIVGALEYAYAIEDGNGTRLSVEFLNWGAHKAVNRTADGGFFSELWKGYEIYGICTESDLPYQSQFDAALAPGTVAEQRGLAARRPTLHLHWIKEWDVHTGLTAAQEEAIKTTLANRQYPVCGGFRWPKKPVWNDAVLQMCPPEEVFDGHSVLLVGYRDNPQLPGGGAFLIRNSGGDGSDGWLPYAYVQEYMNDAAWIEATPVPDSTPAAPQK